MCAPRPCALAGAACTRGRRPAGRVYVEDWETFYAEAEKLYTEHPAHVRRACLPPSAAPACCGPQHPTRRLTRERALQTRYVAKYRHCDGKLVLKVTNDRVVREPRAQPSLGARQVLKPCTLATRQCLKFTTDQQQDLKRMEKLNNLFFAYMCGKDPHQEDENGAGLPPPRVAAEPSRVPTLQRDTACARADPMAASTTPAKPASSGASGQKAERERLAAEAAAIEQANLYFAPAAVRERELKEKQQQQQQAAEAGAASEAAAAGLTPVY